MNKTFRVLSVVSMFLFGTAAVSHAQTSKPKSHKQELTIQVNGMMCGSCSHKVEEAARSIPGVTHATANLATNSVTIETDNGTASESKIINAIDKAGFTATKSKKDRK